MSLIFKYKKTANQQSFTDVQGCTHTSMRGGCLTVPVEKRAQFLDEYFAAYKRKELLAWTERTPTKDPFRYFMDLDFKRGDENNVDVATMQKSLSDLVFKFCGEPVVEDTFKRPWDSVAATRGPKMHAHFPSLIVTRKTAICLTNNIKSHLIRSFPQISRMKWNDIVDRRVYKTGFRMLGSRKSQGAEGKEQREEEERVGKENVGEIPLTYKLVLPSGEQCDLEREHLDFCTMFAEPGTELTPLPGLYKEEDLTDEAASDEDTVVERPKKIRKKAKKAVEVEDEEDDESKRVKIPKEVRQEIEETTGIEAAHLRYGRLSANNIEIVTHSTECPFSKSGGHKSNHQRLFVSAHTIERRCHSTKCAKRVLEYQNASKTFAWFLKFFEGDIQSPALDKNVLELLYNKKGKRNDQPALTGYLNRFVAHIER